MNAASHLNPRWVRELLRYLPIRRQFIIYGNIHDRVPYGEGKNTESAANAKLTYEPLQAVLQKLLVGQGYGIVGFYDLVDAMTFQTVAACREFERLARAGASAPASTRHQATGTLTSDARLDYLRQPNAALPAIRRVVANDSIPAAIVIDWSSRLMAQPGSLTTPEREYLVALAKCARDAIDVSTRGKTIGNLTILLCDRLFDLPPWMYLNNPLVKTIEIGLPDDGERKRYFERFVGNDSDGESGGISALVDLTHGLTIEDLWNIRSLAKRREQDKLGEGRLDYEKTIEFYRFGEYESRWDSEDLRERVQVAEDFLRGKVKGQDAAIQSVLDIIKRSVTGLSGVQESGKRHRKPRGVLFFAGPSGVGKTELAKQLAVLLFSEESAYIRFDMSEYGQEHSDQKLMGAPPGYVGYEEGGQLTGRVKERPFSVLLFDEIEKAHPKILDKFLQILDDGRLTDGKGETVYFSEAVIVFTSNLGAYVDMHLKGEEKPVRVPNILPRAWKCSNGHFAMFPESARPERCPECREAGERLQWVTTPHSEVRRRMMAAIEEHFKFELGRPELYNRFGNNFVVFDYIRENVMREIVQMKLGTIRENLKRDRELGITFDASVSEAICRRANKNSEAGGRAVVNLLEPMLINPLARYLFDKRIQRKAELRIRSIHSKTQDDVDTYWLEVGER